MKALRLLMLFAGLLMLPDSVFATGKPNGPPPPPLAPIPLPEAAQPSAALTPYITHLDSLLALQRVGDGPTQDFCAQATGNLLVLRQQFLSLQDSSAPERKTGFAAAAATCDQLNAALEERQKTVGNILASRNVKGSGKLNEPARKENLTQGIDGGGLAKAVGGVVERDRERQFIAIGNGQTKSGDAAMESMAVNRWNQRSLELRQKIAASFARVR